MVESEKNGSLICNLLTNVKSDFIFIFCFSMLRKISLEFKYVSGGLIRWKLTEKSK